MSAAAAAVDAVAQSLQSKAASSCISAGSGCGLLADELEIARLGLAQHEQGLALYLPGALGARSSKQISDLAALLLLVVDSARRGVLTTELVEAARAAAETAIHSERPIPPSRPIGLAPSPDRLASRDPGELLTGAALGEQGAQAMAAFPSDPALLEETTEVEFSQELDALLASLQNDPLLVYEFVRDSVRFTPYYGSRKSSTFVLETLAGNDFDQASLLIAAYRRLGIPARYVRGTIKLTDNELREWIGVDSVSTARQTLLNGFYPVSVGSGFVQVQHVWVEAFVSIGDYRAIGGGTEDGAWIPLSPSFQKRISNGGPDLAAETGFSLATFMQDLFAGFDGRNPAERYIDGLMAFVAANHPGEQLPGLLWNTESVSVGLEVLPLSLPFTVLQVLATTTEVPESFRHKVTISAGTLSHLVNLAELGSRRVTLAFEPATPADQTIISGYGNIFDTPANLINVRPELRIDGQLVATGGGVDFGSFVTAGVNVTANGYNTPSLFTVNRTTDVVAAGRYALIVLADSYVGASSIPKHRAAFEEGVSNVGGAGFDPDETLGEALFIHGWEYFREQAQVTDVLARSAHIYFQDGVSAAFVGPGIALIESGGQIVAVEARGFLMDVFLNVGSPLAQDGSAGISPADFRIFRTLESSALEHSVFEELFGVEAVSTVKVLQVAADEGIPLFDINSANRSTLVPQLTLSPADVASIEAYLDAGFSVKVPRDPITLNDWTGTGWLAFNPSVTTVVAIIFGYLNGGSLTEFEAELAELVRTGEISQERADAILFGLFDQIRFPVNAEIRSPFGLRRDPVTGQPGSMHEGLDFKTAVGTPVYAVADGYVAARWVSSSYGNVLIVNHGVDDFGSTYYTLQAHNQQFSLNFLDFVSQGGQISVSGNTGIDTTGPHLHWEVFVVPLGGPTPGATSSGMAPSEAFLKGGFEVDPFDRVWPKELTPITPP